MPRISHLAAAIAAAFSALPTSGLANPSGGVAVHGQAVISNPAPKQLLVSTQNGAGSNHSAINWQSFSIGAGESTRFVQPSAASTSINRVVTNTPSSIFGTLSSNGKLVLVNQSGIAVGLGAAIDTAGFTASVLGMTEADAKAGRLRFSLDSLAGQAGPLTVQGNIIARNGDVVLIAPSIELAQTAVVQSEGGSVILVAGQSVEVTGRGLEGISMLLQAPTDQAINLGTLKGDAVGIFAGTLKHSGLIQANQVTVDGGRVVLKASGDAYVQGQGRIEATGGAKGGSVDVLGQRVAIMDQASIDASGATGGGSIRVGGDFQGKNPDVPNANVTYVGADTNLKADALENGNGGKVIVWADDTTRAYGSISARGGASGGDGGFVEVSGKRYLDFVARVDTSAPVGNAGTLLLDPMDVTIVGTGNPYPDGSDTPGGAQFNGGNPNVFAASTSSATNLSWGAINTALGINNVQITTSSSGGGVGNITVQDSGSYSSTNSLTLLAHNNINFNASVVNAGSGAIGAYAGWNGAPPGAGAVTTIAGIGDVNVGIFGAISHFGNLDLVAGKNLNVFSSITSTGGNQLFRAGGDIGFVNNSTLGGAMVVDSLNGSQTIDATGTIQLQAGTTFGGSVTVKAGSGGQSISANRLQINGGAGNGKFASLRTGDDTLSGGGNQTVTVGSGGISMTGGSGLLTTDSDNYAVLAQYGLPGTSQTITVNGTGSIVLQGGSTGKIGVGVGERGSFAGIGSRGDYQLINFTGLGAAGRAITLTGGSVGSNAVAGIFAETGTQTIQGATSIILTGGTGFGSYILDEPNAAVIVAELGSQTISAGTILLRGGASGTLNPAVIHAEGTGALQTITANKIDVLGGAGGGGYNLGNFASIQSQGSQVVNVGVGGLTITGGGGLLTDNFARVEQLSVTGTQTINVTGGGILAVEGGTGTGNYSALRSAGYQGITAGGAGGVRLAGGISGTGNYADLDSGGSQMLTVGTGGLHVVGGANGRLNEAQLTQQSLAGSQTITVTGDNSGSNAILVTGGNGAGGDNSALIYAAGGQTITVLNANGIAIKGGSVGSNNWAKIQAVSGPQTIGAYGIALLGGASGGGFGVGNYATVRSGTAPSTPGSGSQQITVGLGGIVLTGGGGGVLNTDPDTDNYASIHQFGIASTSQTIIVGGGGSIVLQGGSSAKTNVGGDGHGSFVGIESTGGAQLIRFTAGGAISLTGGSVGSRAFAGIDAQFGTQTIQGATSITLAGGTSPAVPGDLNGAFIVAEFGSQTISAGSISLQGGPSGGANAAAIQAWGTSVLQTITADSIQVLGGTGGGGLGTGNYAGIESQGSQVVNVGAGGLTLTGGAGSLTDNKAVINQYGLTGTQTITVDGGGSIVMTGGSSLATTVGLGHGSRAAVNANGTSQLIEFLPGAWTQGSLQLTGGNAGQRNQAQIVANNPASQTITGSPSIILAGGSAGGVVDEGNQALIGSQDGVQTITASSVSATGGVAGIENRAVIQQGYIDGATTYGLSGRQIITITGGGAVTLQGGGGTNNYARIRALGTDGQTLDFQSGGSLTLDGGTGAGGGNFARVQALNGPQSILGSPAISLTGGTAGGIALAGNFAELVANVGTQNIDASSITLTASPSLLSTNIENFASIRSGDTQTIRVSGDVALTAGLAGTTQFASILGPTQQLNIGGNLTLTGGGSVSSANGGGGARIGGGLLDVPHSTNLTLAVGGNVTLNGGSVSGSAIGSNMLGLQDTNIDMTVQGNLALNASAVGSRIGSPLGLEAPGNIFVSAGSISLTTADPVNAPAAIRTLGDIDLFTFGFVNNAGPTALAAGGRWRVWSGNPSPFSGGTPDVRGGLVYDFKHYGLSYATGVPYTGPGTGDGFIYAAPVTITPTLIGPVSKVYDGTAVAALTTSNFSAVGVDGDTVLLSGTGLFGSRNAGASTTRLVTADSIAVSASNGLAAVYGYTTTPPLGVFANIGEITQRALSTWSGSAGDGLWSTPSNWDALPDLSNVQAVSIPASKGTVQYNLTGTNLASINVGAGSALAVTGGTLNVSSGLTTASYSQSGGSYGGAGEVTVNGSFAMTGGTLSVVGNVGISHAGDMLVQGATLESTGGNVNVASSGVLSVIGGALPAAIKARGTMDLTVAGLNLTGTSTSASLISGNSMTINSSGPVVLTGGAGATAFALIDPTISGTIDLTASSLTLQGGSGGGAYASLLNAVGAINMSTPLAPTLISGTGGFGAMATIVGSNVNLSSPPLTTSAVTTFVDVFPEAFAAAVAAQAEPTEEEKAAAASDIVVEGQVCK